MVIDVNYNFCGDKREPIFESIKRWHFSCGERAWDGIDAIREILAVARRKRLPVIYTTNPAAGGWFRSRRMGAEGLPLGRRGGRDRAQRQ